MIQSNNISVIIQGQPHRKLTPKCIASIRKYLPEAEIIFSTWKGTNISALDYDILVENEDPGFFHYSNEKGGKINNVNRQIVSTVAGLKKASRKYAFKMRTDCILTGNSFLKYVSIFPKVEREYRIFDQKILSLSYFTRNPRDLTILLPFHPSDIALFGLKNDILNFFDVPLMLKEEEFYWNDGNNLRNKYVPEQHIFINCLLKNEHYVSIAHQADVTPYNIEQTERYFASNFIFIDWQSFNIKPHRNLYSNEDNHYLSCVTHIEWQQLYKKYVDHSIIVPSRDKQRERLKMDILLTQFYRLLSRISAFPFIGKNHKMFRIKVREKVFYFLNKYLKPLP